MQAGVPSWVGVFLFIVLVIVSIAAHIKSRSYLAACAFSGVLTLVVSVCNYILFGFGQYQRGEISFGRYVGGFPYSLIGIFSGFIVSAIVGMPIWLYKRARQ